jgi:NADH-quinone oxidoreductase subunit A
MLEDYAMLLGIAGASVAAALVILLVERFFRTASSKVETKPAKKTTENTPAWRRYHVHYYIFALLFLAFDMEMAFMYPWAVVFKQLGLEAFADMGVFLLILFVGLLYAWSQKGLQRQ